MTDLGTRWDDERKLWVCDRTERSDLPPHCTAMLIGGIFSVAIPHGIDAAPTKDLRGPKWFKFERTRNEEG